MIKTYSKTNKCQHLQHVNNNPFVLFKLWIAVKPSAILGMCPDCPTDIDLDSNNMETVKLTLQRFNSESGSLKYFALLNVTRATMQVLFFWQLEHAIEHWFSAYMSWLNVSLQQWVSGPYYFFEYTIQETICTKCMTNVNVAHCKMDKSESAVSISRTNNRQYQVTP